MAKKTITSSAQDMQEFNKASTELVAVLNDLSKVLGDNAKAAERFTGDSAKNYTENFREAVSLGKTLSGYTADQLKDRREETKFLKDLTRLQQEQSRVQSKIGFLQDKLINARGAEATYIREALKGLKEVDVTIGKSVEHADKLKETFEEISKQSKFFDNLSDMVKDVPVLSKVFGEFQTASDAARKAAAEGKNGFAAGAKQLGGVFTKFIAAFTIGKIVSGLKDFDERTVSIGRNLNVSREQSDRMVMSLNRAARGMQGLTGADLQQGATMLAESLGTTAISSIETSKELAAQTKYLGISAEESAKQAEFSTATGQNIAKAGNAMRGEVMLSNLRNKTGVKYQAIMKDIANTSNATKLLMKGQGINITQAAIEAKKLGTTMEGIANIGKSMLDFESSIANELEAELLTGGEINNEKARALALMGDTEGLAKEVAKSGVLAKFEGAKNVLQQEALAKAYGMSKEEMADMVVKSKAMTAMGASDQKDLEKKYATQIKAIDAAKASGDLAKAATLEAKLSQSIGNEELERQMKNQTVAEKQAEAMIKMGEAMDKLNIILKPIAAAFEFIGKHIDIITKGMLLMTVLMGPGKLGGMVKNIGGMFKGMSGKVTAATTAATAGGGGIAGAAGKAGAGAAGAGAAGAGGGGGLLAKAGSFFGNIGSKIANSGVGKAVGNVAGKAGDLVGKMNPAKVLTGWLGKNAMKLLKLPIISTLLEGLFAKGDIEGMIQGATDKNTLYQQVGKRTWQGFGAAAGGILGGAIGSLGGPVSILGAIGGNMLGSYVGGALADLIGAEGMGKFMVDNFFQEDKKNAPIALATGGITSGPTRALIGEAGPEAVIPLREFYAKIDELIVAVKQGGNISIGANKLNEAIGLNLHPMR